MRAPWWLAVALAVLAGCTAGPAPAPPSVTLEPSSSATSQQTGSTTATVAPNSCPDVSAANNATNGVIYMGPFGADEVGPLPSGQTVRKLYVGSMRPGSEAAVLVITDPQGRQSRQRRPRPEPQPGTHTQFFPGEFITPVSGAYRLELTIGVEAMCVVVVYA
jgi:hypothetical protein